MESWHWLRNDVIVVKTWFAIFCRFAAAGIVRVLPGIPSQPYPISRWRRWRFWPAIHCALLYGTPSRTSEVLLWHFYHLYHVTRPLRPIHLCHIGDVLCGYRRTSTTSASSGTGHELRASMELWGSPDGLPCRCWCPVVDPRLLITKRW